jgi:hypothetical protein
MKKGVCFNLFVLLVPIRQENRTEGARVDMFWAWMWLRSDHRLLGRPGMQSDICCFLRSELMASPRVSPNSKPMLITWLLDVCCLHFKCSNHHRTLLPIDVSYVNGLSSKSLKQSILSKKVNLSISDCYYASSDPPRRDSITAILMPMCSSCVGVTIWHHRWDVLFCSHPVKKYADPR